MSYNFQSRKQILTLKEVYSPLFNLGVILDPQFPMCDKFKKTRSCAALRATDLDWTVGPEYSLGRKKQKRYPGGVTTDLGGG